MNGTLAAPPAWAAEATALAARVPGLVARDAHLHLGTDADGTVAGPDDLLGALDAAGVAGGAVFALDDPAGLRTANDAVLAAAAASGGRLVPFARLDPHDAPAAELARCLAGGARGVKLHPRAQAFTFDAPGVAAVLAVAHEERLPVLVHAGRGIAPLGGPLRRLARRFPDARIVLAHAAISDLAWLAGEAGALPNVLVDTSWWAPWDVLAALAHVPPGRVLLASDWPYGAPGLNLALTLRAGLALGLGDEALRAVGGGALAAVLRGDAPPDAGPAPGAGALRRSLLLDRAAAFLHVAWGCALAGGDGAEPLSLARQALAVPGGGADAGAARAALAVLDGATSLHDLAVAAMIAATPGVPAALL